MLLTQIISSSSFSFIISFTSLSFLFFPLSTNSSEVILNGIFPFFEVSFIINPSRIVMVLNVLAVMFISLVRFKDAFILYWTGVSLHRTGFTQRFNKFYSFFSSITDSRIKKKKSTGSYLNYFHNIWMRGCRYYFFLRK